MDTKIEQKPWIKRNLKYIIIGVVAIAVLSYLVLSLNYGKSLRVEALKINIVEVKEDSFLEYLDADGLVVPISTVKINAQEEGVVKQVLIDEGVAVKAGDTIALLDNPTLRRQIEEEEAELEKQHISYKEKLIDMEQTSIALYKQLLQAQFEAKNLERKYQLDKQEHGMGFLSKAQFEMSTEEYEYTKQRNELTFQELRNDSITQKLRVEMLTTDLQRQVKKFENSRERLEHLAIKALIDGQLSLVKRPEIGDLVNRGQNIGEIKDVSRFKLVAKISEYYIDRVTQGQSAYIIHADKRYELLVNRVSPEIKEGKFDADFLFVDSIPENLNLGKNFRIQIELSRPENKTVIPRGTFFQNTGGKWIFKLNPSGNKAYRQYMVLGRQNPSQFEVLEGLKPGDKIIISGYDYFGDAEELSIKD